MRVLVGPISTGFDYNLIVNGGPNRVCNEFGRARDDARAKWSLLEQLDLTSQRLNKIPQLHWVSEETTFRPRKYQ